MADETGAVASEATEVRASELPEVRRLLATANEPFRAVLPVSAFAAYLALALDLDGRALRSSLLVVRAEGRVVGTVTFFADASAEGWGGPPDVSGLRAMAVDPTCRRRGIGTALVAACVRRAREAGARALTLHTADWLGDAIRLYERCGFVREPERDLRASALMDVPIEDDFLALAYRLDLPPPER